MKTSASRRFQVAGHCSPARHYMVDLSGRLAEIREMIEAGDYFTINRARQYGKTTILKALEAYIQEDYTVLSLDFQKLSYEDFETEDSFVRALAEGISRKASCQEAMSPEVLTGLHGLLRERNQRARLAALFQCFSRWCAEAEKPVVLNH